MIDYFGCDYGIKQKDLKMLCLDRIGFIFGSISGVTQSHNIDYPINVLFFIHVNVLSQPFILRICLKYRFDQLFLLGPFVDTLEKFISINNFGFFSHGMDELTLMSIIVTNYTIIMIQFEYWDKIIESQNNW